MNLQWKKWCILPAAMLVSGALTLAQDPSATPDSKPKSGIGKRAENQQDRIAQGVKSGQLTAGETANLESKEAAINGEVKVDRAANGGKLTAGEKAQVN